MGLKKKISIDYAPRSGEDHFLEKKEFYKIFMSNMTNKRKDIQFIMILEDSSSRNLLKVLMEFGG